MRRRLAPSARQDGAVIHTRTLSRAATSPQLDLKKDANAGVGRMATTRRSSIHARSGLEGEVRATGKAV
jgi:hypothetical protein